MISQAIAVPAFPSLSVRNQQKDCPIDTARLREIVRDHLERQLKRQEYDIAVFLIPVRRMARLNRIHLGHEGPTDVITFDYGVPGRHQLHGEILVCPAVARIQSCQHHTSWQSEVLRYIIHGMLHLQGYDDRSDTDRRAMKREEDRRLKALASCHPLHLLGARGKRHRTRAG